MTVAASRMNTDTLVSNVDRVFPWHRRQFFQLRLRHQLRVGSVTLWNLWILPHATTLHIRSQTPVRHSMPHLSEKRIQIHCTLENHLNCTHVVHGPLLRLHFLRPERLMKFWDGNSLAIKGFRWRLGAVAVCVPKRVTSLGRKTK